MSTGNTGTVSSHFNFTLPGYDDDTDIDELNTNFNIIDTSLYDAVQDIAQNASDISTLRDSVETMEPSSISLTYVTNSYVSQTEFNRCAFVKVAQHLAILRLNMNVSAMPTNTEVKVMRFSDRTYMYHNAVLPAQGAPNHFNITVDSDSVGGYVGLGNYSGSALSGWVRIAIPIVLA